MSDVFIDKTSGERVQIVDQNDNFFELNNNIRIKKDVFNKKYEEASEVDPNQFFNTQPSNDPLLNMANQLKNIDTTKINDIPSPGAQVKYIEEPVILEDSSMGSAQIKEPQKEGKIQLSKEQKEAMLEQWRQTHPGAQIPAVQDKAAMDDEILLNGDKNINNSTGQKSQPNPLEMMFKMFKNNYDVKLKLNVEEKIPTPQFIGMVQENVEGDAIEYYSNLISDKILKDPKKLRDEIYNQLKTIINEELGIEEDDTTDDIPNVEKTK